MATAYPKTNPYINQIPKGYQPKTEKEAAAMLLGNQAAIKNMQKDLYEKNKPQPQVQVQLPTQQVQTAPPPPPTKKQVTEMQDTTKVEPALNQGKDQAGIFGAIGNVLSGISSFAKENPLLVTGLIGTGLGLAAGQNVADSLGIGGGGVLGLNQQLTSERDKGIAQGNVLAQTKINQLENERERETKIRMAELSRPINIVGGASGPSIDDAIKYASLFGKDLNAKQLNQLMSGYMTGTPTQIQEKGLFRKLISFGKGSDYNVKQMAVQ